MCWLSHIHKHVFTNHIYYFAKALNYLHINFAVFSFFSIVGQTGTTGVSFWYIATAVSLLLNQHDQVNIAFFTYV